MAATRAPFLKTRYGGYFHRDIPEEDAELTHVGPGTPGGEYLRRFWQPVLLLRRSEGPAAQVRMLGEDLVAFRDRQRRGRPPRAALPASRHLARIRAGRREGHPLLLSRLAVRRRRHDPRNPGRAGRQHPQRPALSWRLSGARGDGIVFAYMGPPDKKPAFPVYDTFVRPGWRMIPGRKYFYPCNWLQMLENTWTRRTPPSCTRSSAAPCSPRSSASCPNSTSSRRRSA